jgi:hypothetical protein
MASAGGDGMAKAEEAKEVEKGREVEENEKKWLVVSGREIPPLPANRKGRVPGTIVL